MARETVSVIIHSQGQLLECPECYHQLLETTLLLGDGIQLTCASCKYTLSASDLDDQLLTGEPARSGG